MARKKYNIHYIYKTTCDVTKRYYIGMHSTLNLDDGYMGSGLRLRRSIRKYGKEKHIKEILEFVDSREELAKRERVIVNKELLTEVLCMNLMIGGECGGFMNEAHMMKCSKAGNEAFKNKMENDIDFLIKFQKRGSKNFKKAHKEGKIKYDTFTGRKHSEESKQKISETKKGKGKGTNNSQYGSCWITNDIESKKVMRGDVIPDGWRLGRKVN